MLEAARELFALDDESAPGAQIDEVHRSRDAAEDPEPGDDA